MSCINTIWHCRDHFLVMYDIESGITIGDALSVHMKTLLVFLCSLWKTNYFHLVPELLPNWYSCDLISSVWLSPRRTGCTLGKLRSIADNSLVQCHNTFLVIYFQSSTTTDITILIDYIYVILYIYIFLCVFFLLMYFTSDYIWSKQECYIVYIPKW
jgi:hypothetical protein